MAESPVPYLLCDELRIVTQDARQHHVISNAQADVHNDKESVRDEQDGVDNPVHVQCDLHEHIQDEERVRVAHGGTSLTSQSGETEPEKSVLGCRH